MNKYNPHGQHFYFSPSEIPGEIALNCLRFEDLGCIGTFLPNELEFLRDGGFSVVRRGDFLTGEDLEGKPQVGLSEVKIFRDMDGILKRGKKAYGELFIEVTLYRPDGVAYLELSSRPVDENELFEGLDRVQEEQEGLAKGASTG